MKPAVHVVKLEPTSQWDQTVLNLLWSNQLTPTGMEFIDTHGMWPTPIGAGIILVIPGRYWFDDEFNHNSIAYINGKIADYPWVLAIKTGDEEDLLDIDRIEHPNIRWWIQTPRTDKTYGGARRFGVGFTPHFNGVRKNWPVKDIDVYLAAQNTHPRRFEAFAMTKYLNVDMMVLNESPGFTQGLTPDVYTDNMVHSKIALAPAGPASPDSFRLYEALESHCVPIADDVTMLYDSNGYWRSIFDDPPFPIITDWRELPQLVDDVMSKWVSWSNRIAAWWIRQKREYMRWLIDDLIALGASVAQQQQTITAIVPVSPIASHPDTAIIEETIGSIRYWLPDAEIILTFDGVRPEQEDLRDSYEEAIRRILWYADHSWGHVTPIIFEQHQHQSGMMRVALEHVKTPLLLYVEQDTPLVCDEHIPWEELRAFILKDHADVIRLHHEALILDVHQHLMKDRQGPFVRTAQWSQRPHLASRPFYERIMKTQFSADARCFIEERMASVLESEWRRSARVFVYAPEVDNIKRSYHLDGRAGGPQFIESQVF